jgi:ABC-type multidrug transport system permease subunit
VTTNQRPARPLASASRPDRTPAAAVVLALVRRDLAQRRIVKFALALDLVFGGLNLVVFQFIGRVVRHPAPGLVTQAGGYFSFASVGIAFILVIQTATAVMTRQVREEQHSGTFELVVAQPVGVGPLALGLAGFPFLFATLRALAYLLLAAALGLSSSHANWAGVVIVLLAAAPSVAAIGIVLAGLALMVDRGDVLARFVAFGLGFLSGAYFPVSEFTPAVRAASDALPTRIALDGLRAALAGRPWWPAAAALVAFGLITLPAAVAVFAGSLRSASRRGRLTRG